MRVEYVMIEVATAAFSYCIKGGGSSSSGRGPNDSPHGTRYQIQVDSIDEALVKAKKNGAMIVRDKMDDFYQAWLILLALGLVSVNKKINSNP